ncbi:MAG: VOC family protein, partial [Thermodesulfobacteriota bacterium]
GANHPFRKTIYFIDPEGYQFEFIQYLSEIPSEKNMYGGETNDIKRVSTK